MPKNKGMPFDSEHQCPSIGKGGKNRRRGKNDGEVFKRELEFKEDGQGMSEHGAALYGPGRCRWPHLCRVRQDFQDARKRKS